MKNISESASDYQLPPGLTCQKCGRNDATIRLVSYPYAYSLIYTVQKEFAGRWCFKHRTLYMVLAAAITSILGFWGFQGIFIAPKILIQLAKGGRLHKGNNTKQLRSLMEAKKTAWRFARRQTMPGN